LCMAERGAYELRFVFPNKQSHILGALTPLLLFSGFSFLCLVASFLCLAYLLKKQSKLSAIKNDFVNNMTHELKTPLFTISIASRLLAAGDHNRDEKQAKYVESIQQEIQRLNQLVDKILVTSQLEQKKLSLDKNSMDLHQAIKKAVEDFELIQTEKQGSFRLELNAVAHHIEADETHIMNCIYNLLDNAFKYSAARPEILIRTENKGAAILLSVKDNGIGFDEETKRQVFERFFRASTGNVHNVKGHGIGLSYVKSVMEAHNGIIGVRSEPDKGSEFTLQIPLQLT
jgi:two-component system phosphate regulon sensor histidine kinase PhoR